jgi:hypothetical protein
MFNMNRKSTLLLPLHSRLIPNQVLRNKALDRNTQYKIENFESLEDWFFFTHIDPVQRLIHAVGMYIGLFFFLLMFIDFGLQSFIYYILGVFFYYVSGIISHQFYDGGSGRSHPKFLLPTFIPVIKINLATSLGYYDSVLRDFVKKYPFVETSYELKEVPKDKYYSFIRGRYFTTPN